MVLLTSFVLGKILYPDQVEEITQKIDTEYIVKHVYSVPTQRLLGTTVLSVHVHVHNLSSQGHHQA